MPTVDQTFVTEIQRGTATLTAGSVAVTFTNAFSSAPTVFLQKNSAGTTVVNIHPASVTATGFTAISKEITGAVTGGTAVTTGGTTSTRSFNWFAFLTN